MTYTKSLIPHKFGEKDVEEFFKSNGYQTNITATYNIFNLYITKNNKTDRLLVRKKWQEKDFGTEEYTAIFVPCRFHLEETVKSVAEYFGGWFTPKYSYVPWSEIKPNHVRSSMDTYSPKDPYVNFLAAQLFAQISAMNAENNQRISLGESMAYVDDNFYNVQDLFQKYLRDYIKDGKIVEQQSL